MSKLFDDLIRLDEHWRSQGASVVQLLDQLGRQAHGLAGLPPEPPDDPEPQPERRAGDWQGEAEQNEQ